MNSLNSQQMWELMHARQAEMIKEAQQEHLAKVAQASQKSGWRNFFRREVQKPAIVINTNATPELG